MSSVRDIIIITVLLFAVGISVVFAVKIGHQVNVNLLLTPSINNSANAVSVINHADAAINMTDYIYLALFVGFFISVMITGWFVGGYPIMAPIYFFIIIIFVFVAVVLQLAWGDIAANAQVSSTLLSLPLTSFILSHLGYLMAVTGLLGILALFAKPSSNSGGLF